MEPMPSMRTAVVLLALTAIGGPLMAGIRFAGKPHPPTWPAMGHGFIAGAAVTLLVYGYLTVGAGGIALNLGYHWRRLALPKWRVVVHALIAVSGFVPLAVAAWR